MNCQHEQWCQLTTRDFLFPYLKNICNDIIKHQKYAIDPALQFDKRVVSISIEMLAIWKNIFSYQYGDFPVLTDGISVSVSEHIRATIHLPPNLVKSRNREIWCYDDRISPKCNRHLGSAVAEVPVKFQSEWKSIDSNVMASRLH